ncbi:hypothetical protein BU17DRAFT_69402 [Hysterangium stoloniferum]|nr:hypothetical protein BU17DRAFT_69402 [Hysterangium stoloniferum]
MPDPSLIPSASMEPLVPIATIESHHEDLSHGSSSLVVKLHIPMSPSELLETGISLSKSGGLAKLQTYLPTGTWVIYTALQTWALALRPSDPPASPNSTCNTTQRAALLFVIVLASSFSFLTSFVKRFVYDMDGVHIVYPSPDMFDVSQEIVDPVTRIKFPCETTAHRYCWPCVDDAGQLVHDDQQRLKVLVFKLGVPIHVDRKPLFTRLWNALFRAENNSTSITRSDGTPPLQSQPGVISEGGVTSIDVGDATIAYTPSLEPRWKHTIWASSYAYVDLHRTVWEHAAISLLAFMALSMFSTQVRTCLYPALPDYISSIVQTGMLIVLSVLSTLYVSDHAVSLGQTPSHYLISSPVSSSASTGDSHAHLDVPHHLIDVVEMVVWVKSPSTA